METAHGRDYADHVAGQGRLTIGLSATKIRRWRANPAFILVAVGSLGLGIGAPAGHSLAGFKGSPHRSSSRTPLRITPTCDTLSYVGSENS